MAIDNSITKKLEDFLAMTDRTPEEVVSGATLLLQLNRNKSLFQTVLTNPKRFESTVVYELNKFVPIRQRGQTLEDVKRDAEQLLGELKSAVDEEPAENESKDDSEKGLPMHGGKRPDHDSLPEDIQAIWPQNAERWKKIKSLYNTCLGITETCDLAESLNTLKETWYKYKSEFARYDDFIVESNDKTGENGDSAADSTKAVTNARSYLSKMVKDDKLLNMKKAYLADGADEKAIEAYRGSLQNTQDRVQLLLDKGEVIGNELRTKLVEAGVVFPEEKPSEIVDPSENADSTDDKDVNDEQGQES